MESSIELVENTQAPETILNEQLQSKLLLIEHDNYVSKALSLNVAQSGYQISKISSEENISSALGKCLLEQTPDMIVFDIGLAGGTKLHAIDEIRMLYRGLLVIVSSQNNEQEQVDALKLGVDDFIPKPVDSRILMMRIAALFRRQNNKEGIVGLASLAIGDVCLQPLSQRCLVSGDAVKLTTFEFNLLKLLLKHEGQILSRDQIYSTLLNRSYNGTERTLDVRMSQLREKLTLAGMKKNQIETVWGQGYMFNNINA